MRLPIIVALLAVLLIPLAGAMAQETERVGPPIMLWAVPRLQLFLEDGDREFFRGIDASLALPLTPHTHVTATYSWDTQAADRLSALFNYDHPLGEDTVLRGSAGIVRSEPSFGLTVHRSFARFGVGAFAQSVDGSFEGGVMMTRQVPWGVKLGRPRQLKRTESADWPSGAGSVGDIGARAALVYHAGGTPDELFTTTAYFPNYRHSWPREGQSVQGGAYAAAQFAPPLKPAWRYQTEGPIRTSAAIVDGVAYVGSTDGWLYALDIAQGRRLWRFPAEAPITGAPAWLDGRLYFGTEAGDVFCVAQPRKDSPPAGQLVWRYRTSSAVVASPLVTDSGLVIVGSTDGYIYALDRDAGRLAWKIATGGPILASASKLAQRIPAGVDAAGQPTFRSAGVLVGSSDGKLYAIEEVKGQVVWTFATDGPITAAAVAYGDRLLVGTRSGSIYGLDGTNGHQQWVARVNGSIAYAPAVDETCAYVATSEGQVVALEANSGRVLWQNDLKAALAASPTLVRAPLMYLASRDGRLWTLDRSTGKVVSVYRESAPLTTCAVIADGHLLVGSDKGTVFAYVPGGGGPLLSPADMADLPQPIVPVLASAPPTAATTSPASPSGPVVTPPAPTPAPVTPPLAPPATPAATSPGPGAASVQGPPDFPSPVAPSGKVGPPAPPVVEPTTPPVTPPTAPG